MSLVEGPRSSHALLQGRLQPFQSSIQHCTVKRDVHLPHYPQFLPGNLAPATTSSRGERWVHGKMIIVPLAVLAGEGSGTIYVFIVGRLWGKNVTLHRPRVTVGHELRPQLSQLSLLEVQESKVSPPQTQTQISTS